MLLYKLFRFKFFILGMIVGIILFLIYPQKKVVTIYPNDDNKNKIQYKDNADNCYEFNVYEVECPMNPSEIKIIPIQ